MSNGLKIPWIIYACRQLTQSYGIFFGKFGQVVIWYLIDMHKTYRVFFFSYYIYMGEMNFWIENLIYKIFYTSPRGWSGLTWLGKIRHHYAGNLLIFPLTILTIFFIIFFYLLYIIELIFHSIHLNDFPDPILLYIYSFKL